MAVAGALIGGALGAFGRKPKIPQLQPVNPTAVQQQTLADNAATLPGAQQLGSQINDYNVKEQLGILSKALDFVAPGQLQQAQGIVSSQLRGEVPADVAAAVQRRAAAQSLLGGYGVGSSMMQSIGHNLSLRDFGLTSMAQQQQGLANFSSLASLAPKPQAFDVTSMFFTPQQRLSAAFTERNDQFQRNLLAEQVAAAPDPATAALGKEIDRFFNTIAQAAMGAAGGGGGGMGGMGG